MEGTLTRCGLSVIVASVVLKVSGEFGVHVLGEEVRHRLLILLVWH